MAIRRLGMLALAVSFGVIAVSLDHRAEARMPLPDGTAATPTVTAASAAPSGTILFQDNFSDPNAGVLPKTAVRPCYQRGYVNGEYQLAKIDSSTPDSPTVNLPGTYADATVDVDVRVEQASGGSAGAFAGVQCRSGANSSMGYELDVFPLSDAFTFLRRDSDTNFTIVAGGPQLSAVVHQGTGSNHLTLTCAGSTITASVNGTQVASIQDSTYSSGPLALRAAVLLNSLPATVDARFAHLVVTQP